MSRSCKARAIKSIRPSASIASAALAICRSAYNPGYPPTESSGNVAPSGSVKIPTGICDGKGSAILNGQTITAVADQSLQPGDCRWGFTLATQAYRQIWLHTML